MPERERKRVCNEGLSDKDRGCEVRRTDVACAIRHAKNSAMGVGGISATHWKRLGGIAIEFLTKVAQAIQEEGWETSAIEAVEAWAALKTPTNITEASRSASPRRRSKLMRYWATSIPRTPRGRSCLWMWATGLWQAFHKRWEHRTFSLLYPGSRRGPTRQIHHLKHSGPGKRRCHCLL